MYFIYVTFTVGISFSWLGVPIKIMCNEVSSEGCRGIAVCQSFNCVSCFLELETDPFLVILRNLTFALPRAFESTPRASRGRRCPRPLELAAVTEHA